MKLGQNVYDHRSTDEFDYVSKTQNRMTGFICPLFWENPTFDFVYSLTSANVNQLAPYLVKIYLTIFILDELHY